MAENLPTLKGLRAFEEAFLLGSYTSAAKKLNVQQPAISYQIKRLEEDLGVTLFAKEQGRLVPTPAAHELFETLTLAFDSIRRTANKLRKTTESDAFAIATYPGIGTHWLSSRLTVLSKALNVPVKVVTLVQDRDIMREQSDCMILFGLGNWPGFDARLLMPEVVCPVASPDLATRLAEAPDGTIPEGVSLIDQEDRENRWLGWSDWEEQVKQTIPLPTEKLLVNDHGFALQLALAGNGVSLAWLGVVEDLIAGGSLVPLSEEYATSQAGYWLVARPGFFERRRGRVTLEALTKPRMI